MKLAADEATLAVELSAEDEAAIKRLESVVAEHLKRFTFREELVFVWRRSMPELVVCSPASLDL